jgi:GAF domain-containing protein
VFEKVAEHLDRLKAKRRTIHDGAKGAESEKLFSFYIRIMAKAVDAERCSLFIHDPETNRVWLKAGTGMKEGEIDVAKGDSIVGRVISSGEPEIDYGLDAQPGAHKAVDEETGFVTRSILCVPVKSPNHHEVTGAFEILNKRDEKFTDEDVSLALEVAQNLQRQVDDAFLEQQIFGLSERLYLSAKRTTQWLVGSVVVIFLMLFLYLTGLALVPMF